MVGKIEIELRVQMKRKGKWITLSPEVIGETVMVIENEPLALLEAIQKWGITEWVDDTYAMDEFAHRLMPKVNEVLKKAQEVLEPEPPSFSNYPVPLKAEGLEETELPGL